MTAWTKAVRFASSSCCDEEIWYGKVATTGTSTVTVTWSSSVASQTPEYSAQEFTAGLGTGTVWGVDHSGTLNNTSSSTTTTYPSLSPSGTGELYFGYLTDNTATGGSTSGFTYASTAQGNQVTYNPNVSSPNAYQPTGTQTPAGISSALAAIFTASSRFHLCGRQPRDHVGHRRHDPVRRPEHCGRPVDAQCSGHEQQRLDLVDLGRRGECLDQGGRWRFGHRPGDLVRHGDDAGNLDHHADLVGLGFGRRDGVLGSRVHRGARLRHHLECESHRHAEQRFVDHDHLSEPQPEARPANSTSASPPTARPPAARLRDSPTTPRRPATR